MARRDLTGALDVSVLEGMTGGDDAVSEEVLALFVQQSGLWAPMLEPGAPGWRDAAHTLRGAAGGIGAAALARACAIAEQAADGPAAAAPLERVVSELQAVLGDVAAFRHELMLRSLRA